MHLVTVEEMVALDRQMIDVIGIPAASLMENAGREVAAVVARILRGTGPGLSGTSGDSGSGESGDASRLRRLSGSNAPCLILVGKGNNGGDGLIAARHLLEMGIRVHVVYAVPPEQLSGDAALQRDIAAQFGVSSEAYQAGKIAWDDYSIVVDALLGTGSSGAPRGAVATLIREANASGLAIIALDIPSGIDADTGAVHEPCIRADVTVALAFAKRGHVQHPGAEMTGALVVRQIGIAAHLADELGVRTYLLDEQMLVQRLGCDPRRPRGADTHKGTYGHVLVAAGTRAMIGAGMLCTLAALRAGCGLATWALPDSLVPSVLGRVPEAMLAGVPDSTVGGSGEGSSGSGSWTAESAGYVLTLANSRDALVAGPGLGRFPRDGAWLRAIWDGCARPLVLDADALNALADRGDFARWPRRDAATVLTPHPGEMARLAGTTARSVQRDRIGASRRFAVEHGVTLVLKGSRTVCATPDGSVYVNVNGNPGMATAGAGDALAGVIAALLAQGLSAEQAAALGVYLHGAAGDRAAANRPAPASLLARDIIDAL